MILLFRSETRTLLYKLFLFVEYYVAYEWQTEDELIGLYRQPRHKFEVCFAEVVGGSGAKTMGFGLHTTEPPSDV